MKKATVQHRPDFLKRLKKIYGTRILKTSGADLLAAERARYSAMSYPDTSFLASLYVPDGHSEQAGRLS